MLCNSDLYNKIDLTFVLYSLSFKDMHVSFQMFLSGRNATLALPVICCNVCLCTTLPVYNAAWLCDRITTTHINAYIKTKYIYIYTYIFIHVYIHKYTDRQITWRRNLLISSHLYLTDMAETGNQMVLFTWVTYAGVCQTVNIFGIVSNIINIVCFITQGFKEAINVSLLGNINNGITLQTLFYIHNNVYPYIFEVSFHYVYFF